MLLGICFCRDARETAVGADRRAGKRGLAESVASSLAETTGLPPFTYHGGALPVPGQPYLRARNLLANRLYQCPVVYCEPFVMNHQPTSLRLQAGDYEGTQEINGTSYPSIFRQCAHGVLQGLVKYYARPSS